MMDLPLKQFTIQLEPLNATSAKTFNCIKCDRIFKAKSNLTRHIFNVHCDTRAYTCGECGRRYTEKKNLRRHLFFNHKIAVESKIDPDSGIEDNSNIITNHVCNYCNKEFKSSSTLTKHILNFHRDTRTHVCSECGRKFMRKNSLQRHVLLTHKNVNYPDRHGEFEDKLNLGNDFSLVHYNTATFINGDGSQNFLEEPEKFKCDECDREFENKSNLANHISDVHCYTAALTNCDRGQNIVEEETQLPVRHSLTPEKFECNDCDAEFEDKSNFANHISEFHCNRTALASTQLEHSLTREKFKYNDSDGKFESESAPSMHTSSFHYNVRARACGKCGQKFMEEKSLQKHLLTHEKVKSNFCDKKFQRKLQLLKHHSRKHTSLAQKKTPRRFLIHEKVKCNLCDREFERKSHLQKHYTRKHASVAQIYFCKKCDKAFQGKRKFLNHSCIRQLSFTCDECGKKFNSKSNLQQHVMKHLLECDKKLMRAFICHYCGEKFETKFSIRQHIQNIHDSKPLYVCETCEKAFRLKKYFQEHILTHVKSVNGQEIEEHCKQALSICNNEEKPYSCMECGDKFKSEDSISAHVCKCEEDQVMKSTPAEQSSFYLEDESGSEDSCALSPANRMEKKFRDFCSVLASASTPYNFCPACHKCFDRHDILTDHVKKCVKYNALLLKEKEQLRGTFDYRKYQCGICYQIFVFLRSFVSHLDQEHNTQFFYHECTKICAH